MLPKIPKFASEREEADWWYERRDTTGEEFLKAAKSGQLRAGPSSHTLRLAAARGISTEQLQAEMDSKATAPAKILALPKLPRSA